MEILPGPLFQQIQRGYHSIPIQGECPVILQLIKVSYSSWVVAVHPFHDAT